jgi:PKD repeat protein
MGMGTTDPYNYNTNTSPLDGYVLVKDGFVQRYELDPNGSTSPTSTPTTPGGVTTSGVTTSAGVYREQYPVASFTYVLQPGRKVKFTSTSLYATSYSWSFGDGTTSTEKHPIRVYSADGLKTVRHYAQNSAGRDISTQYINVTETTTLDFSHVTGGLTVFLTLDSNIEGTPLWEFGDGAVSTQINPVHTYATAGTKTVRVTMGTLSVTHQVEVEALTLGENYITLEWQDNSDDESWFKIYHSTDGVNFNLIDQVGANTTTANITLSDHGVDPYVTNYFKVLAHNSNGSSDYTNTVMTNFQPPDTEPPVFGAGLLEVTNLSDTSLFLVWPEATDDRPGVISYIVTQNGTPLPGSTTDLAQHIQNLIADTDYTFTVVAVDEAENMSLPLTVATRTLAEPPPPPPK